MSNLAEVDCFDSKRTSNISAMPSASDIGKSLVAVGLVIAVAGLLLWAGVGRSWLGRLPGDIHFRRGNTQVYIPIVTCLVISVVLTLLSWFFRNRN